MTVREYFETECVRIDSDPSVKVCPFFTEKWVGRRNTRGEYIACIGERCMAYSEKGCLRLKQLKGE